MMGRRRKRVWKTACWLIIGLGIAGWARSCTTWAGLRYNTGRLIAPDAAAQRAESWWMFRLRTYRLALTHGTVVLSVSEYDSMGPEPERLSQQWADQLGFSAWSVAASNSPAFRWLDWAWPDRAIVLGTGFEAFSRGGNRVRAILAPLALPIAIAAAPLLISWRRRCRFRHRLETGRCVHCGYNRAGLAETQSCPECGGISLGEQKTPAGNRC